MICWNTEISPPHLVKESWKLTQKIVSMFGRVVIFKIGQPDDSSKTSKNADTKDADNRDLSAARHLQGRYYVAGDSSTDPVREGLHGRHYVANIFQTDNVLANSPICGQ